MLIKILGMIDSIAGLILLFGSGIKLPVFISILFGILLLIKSTFNLFKDFASWIDIFAGITFLLSYFFIVPSFLMIIIGVLILQKGAFSFL